MDKFITAKMLYGINEDPKVLQGPFEQLGLYEDQRTLLSLERTFAEWKQIEQSKQKARM